MWTRVEGEGQHIIFIHGWTLDHRDEARTYEPIFAETTGWCRHYLDLPGMGRSPARADIRDMDGMLDACVEVIESLVGTQRFLLAGTSAGAYLARGVLTRLGRRVDGLLLRAPLVIPADARRDLDPMRPIIENPHVLETLSNAERAALGDILIQTPAYTQALLGRLRDAVAPATAAADHEFLSPIRDDTERYRFSFDPDAADVLFSGPSLVITGRHDARVGYRDAWRLVMKLPRSTYALLDRAEHGLPIDQQALFAQLVREWLARVQEMRHWRQAD